MSVRSQTMSRVLVAAGGVGLVVAAVTGRGGLFVRSWFLPVVGLAGALLVMAAARGGRTEARASLLLVVPVVVGLTLPASRAGAPSLQAASSTNVGARFGDTGNPLLAGRGGPVTVLQVRTAERQLGAVALVGRDVTTTGFVSAPGAVSRLAMVCCAADARPVSVPVVGTSLPQGQWVSVRGRLTVTDGRLVLTAYAVQRVPTPSDPIL